MGRLTTDDWKLAGSTRGDPWLFTWLGPPLPHLYNENNKEEGKGKEIIQGNADLSRRPLGIYSILPVLQYELVARSHMAMSYVAMLENLLYAGPKLNTSQVSSPLSSQQYYPQSLVIPFHRQRNWCMNVWFFPVMLTLTFLHPTFISMTRCSLLI